MHNIYTMYILHCVQNLVQCTAVTIYISSTFPAKQLLFLSFLCSPDQEQCVCTHYSFKFGNMFQTYVPGLIFQIQISGHSSSSPFQESFSGRFELDNTSLLSPVVVLRIGSSVNIFLLPVQAPVEKENREDNNNIDPGHPDTHSALLL